MPSPPPARLPLPNLMRRMTWAGITTVDDEDTEYAAVAFVVPVDVAEALLTRSVDSAKVAKQVGEHALTILGETYEVGSIGEWLFGEDIEIPDPRDTVDADEDEPDDEDGEPGGLDPEADLSLDDLTGWDPDED